MGLILFRGARKPGRLLRFTHRHFQRRKSSLRHLHSVFQRTAALQSLTDFWNQGVPDKNIIEHYQSEVSGSYGSCYYVLAMQQSVRPTSSSVDLIRSIRSLRQSLVYFKERGATISLGHLQNQEGPGLLGIISPKEPRPTAAAFVFPGAKVWHSFLFSQLLQDLQTQALEN